MKNKGQLVFEPQMNLTYIGKKTFSQNLLYFTIITDFGADNEIDNSSIGNKTTNVYEQNPVFSGYYIASEMGNSVQSGCY